MSEVTVKNFDELIKALTKNIVPVKETITKWEYTRMRYLDEHQMVEIKEQFQARINTLGKDGWEAVCILPDGMILFKKPLV